MMAVRVAQENVKQSWLENIHVAPGDLLKGVEIEADVIVANILAYLIHLTDVLINLVKDEGYLIMSGIIRTSGTWCVSRLSQLDFSWGHDPRGMECLRLQEDQGCLRCDWRLACSSIL